MKRTRKQRHSRNNFDELSFVKESGSIEKVRCTGAGRGTTIQSLSKNGAVTPKYDRNQPEY